MAAGYTKTVCVPSGNNRKAPRINDRVVDDVTSEKLMKFHPRDCFLTLGHQGERLVGDTFEHDLMEK